MLESTIGLGVSIEEDLDSADGTSLPPWRLAVIISLVGIFYAALFMLSFWLLDDVPGAQSTDEEVVAYYESGEQRIASVVALYLMPFAGIAFLWFSVLLRMWIGNRSTRKLNQLLSNVQLVSGVVFVALFFAAAAAMSMTSLITDLGDGDIDPLIARQFPQFGGALLFVFAMRMAAMFVFTSTSLIRGTDAIPRWFVIVGYAVGLFLLLSASLNPGLIMVFPIWVLVLCLLVIIHARRFRAAKAAHNAGGAG